MPASCGESSRYFRPLSTTLYFDVPAENSDYEVSSRRPTKRKRKPLSCSGKKGGRATSASNDSRDFRPAERRTRAAWRKLLHLRDPILPFSFLLFLSRSCLSSFRLFPCPSQGGSQSFGPVSLILSCLPAKLYLGCILPPFRNLPTDYISLVHSFSLILSLVFFSLPVLPCPPPLIFHSPPLGEKCTLAVSPVDKDTKEYAVHLRISRSRATGIFHIPWVHVVALRSVFITDGA